MKIIFFLCHCCHRNILWNSPCGGEYWKTWIDQFGKLCLCFYCSVTQLCLTLCNMDCSMPVFSVLRYIPEFAQTHVHWISRAIQPPYPLLPSSSALNISKHQGLFQWVSLHIRWLKYWCFSFSISPSNKYSGLISFRIDWFEHLALTIQPLSAMMSLLLNMLSRFVIASLPRSCCCFCCCCC